jgi:uncharacterized protein (DUF486 family)
MTVDAGTFAGVETTGTTEWVCVVVDARSEAMSELIVEFVSWEFAMVERALEISNTEVGIEVTIVGSRSRK